jgi:hypothetical protein
MWNWLFWSLWSEIGHVISYNGLTPDNGDMEQLRKAIQAQIDASTGGGDPSSYLTLLQASARLPIFPEVQNANAHFGVTSPATGQVRVPGGVNFLHRGISPYNTTQTDIATDASKIYHLRWNKTDGFTLKDLASGGYNPGTVSENDPRFDSTYDDILVARVITNSSNVPTVTNLVNKSTLIMSEIILPSTSATDGVSSNWFGFTKNLNWARRPTTHSLVLAKGTADNNSVDNDFNIRPLGASLSDLTVLPALFDIDRYRLSQTILRDNTTTLEMHFSARA